MAIFEIGLRTPNQLLRIGAIAIIGIALEAIATGLPVVATDLPCFADQLRSEENALLVPAGSAATLAEACARLVREADLRARLGAAGREVIWALDDAAMSAQHLADFETLLHERNS